MAPKIHSGLKGGLSPSDALIEAVRFHTSTGSFITAARDARQALQAVGREQEAALIDALYHPRTKIADRPIAFAIQAVRRHGRILEHPRSS